MSSIKLYFFAGRDYTLQQDQWLVEVGARRWWVAGPGLLSGVYIQGGGIESRSSNRMYEQEINIPRRYEWIGGCGVQLWISKKFKREITGVIRTIISSILCYEHSAYSVHRNLKENFNVCIQYFCITSLNAEHTLSTSKLLHS